MGGGSQIAGLEDSMHTLFHKEPRVCMASSYPLPHKKWKKSETDLYCTVQTNI